MVERLYWNYITMELLLFIGNNFTIFKKKNLRSALLIKNCKAIRIDFNIYELFMFVEYAFLLHLETINHVCDHFSWYN